MNLPDLITRPDRALQLVSGKAEPAIAFWQKERRRAVIFDAGTELLLQQANEFECLRGLPSNIGWRVWRPQPSSAEKGDNEETVFSIEALNAAKPSEGSEVFGTVVGAIEAQPVTFTWPKFAGNGSGYGLRLKNSGAQPVAIDVGPRFISRSSLLPLVRGRGIEIGPGLNPHILPSDSVEVQYVESASADEWVRNYKKTGKPSQEGQDDLWSRYIVADAQTLSDVPDSSLDFIYSNHVFEHLMNPLGVLENWRRKLTPSGVVLGVVPDCRYIFDARQPPSTFEEWLGQYAKGQWTIQHEQYERWCRYTAPYNTPEDLIQRKYSIHVHFYTTASFGALCQHVVDKGLFQSAALNTSPNHRDFGFVLRAAESQPESVLD